MGIIYSTLIQGVDCHFISVEYFRYSFIIRGPFINVCSFSRKKAFYYKIHTYNEDMVKLPLTQKYSTSGNVLMTMWYPADECIIIN